MEKDNESPKEYVTPTILAIGCLLLIFGMIPIFVAINDGNKGALFIGLCMIAVGVVLFVIGKFQSRELLKKLSGKNKGRN